MAIFAGHVPIDKIGGSVKIVGDYYGVPAVNLPNVGGGYVMIVWPVVIEGERNAANDGTDFTATCKTLWVYNIVPYGSLEAARAVMPCWAEEGG